MPRLAHVRKPARIRRSAATCQSAHDFMPLIAAIYTTAGFATRSRQNVARRSAATFKKADAPPGCAVRRRSRIASRPRDARDRAQTRARPRHWRTRPGRRERSLSAWTRRSRSAPIPPCEGPRRSRSSACRCRADAMAGCHGTPGCGTACRSPAFLPSMRRLPARLCRRFVLYGVVRTVQAAMTGTGDAPFR